MGLADFLAEAAGDRGLGRAMGGMSEGRKRLEQFNQVELPKLYDAIKGATSVKELRAIMPQAMEAWNRAGLPIDRFEKFSEGLIGPALENLRREELESIRRDYGPRTQYLGRVSGPEPTEPGAPPIAPLAPYEVTAPGKPLDFDFSMRMGQATGANPAGYKALLETPGEVAAKETSRKQIQQAIDERTRASGIKLPGSAGEVGITAGTLMEPGAGPLSSYMTGLNPQREKPESEIEHQNKLLTLREAEAQHRAAGAADRVAATEERARGVTERAGFNQAAELRKEYQAQSKDFQKVRDSYNRISTSAKSPTPAGDLSMLFNYMKMLDPGSVVRESEFRSAATAKPLLERLGLSWDAVGSLWAGQKMTPGMRQDFLNRAQQLYNAEAEQHQKRVDEYRRLAESYKLDPNRVVTDLGATTAGPATTPAASTPGGPTPEEVKAAKQRLGIP